MEAAAELINKFQYHATRELDLLIPRYGEDPTPLLASVQQYLSKEDANDPRTLNIKQHKKFLKYADDFLKNIPFYQRISMRKSLEQLREFLWWREAFRDLSTRFYYYIRKFTLHVGVQFREQGLLDDVQDVFHFSKDEIHAILSGVIDKDEAVSILERNKTYYHSFRHFNNPNELGAKFGMAAINSVKPPDEHQALSGVPCSPGIIEGRIKVIRDIFDADRLQQGDILITPYTDPGWTSKFSLIQGVATETGGVLSHAAVIAREYGIPAVLAIPDLTRILKDDQHVRIDGNTGNLYIL